MQKSELYRVLALILLCVEISITLASTVKPELMPLRSILNIVVGALLVVLWITWVVKHRKMQPVDSVDLQRFLYYGTLGVLFNLNPQHTFRFSMYYMAAFTLPIGLFVLLNGVYGLGASLLLFGGILIVLGYLRSKRYRAQECEMQST